MDYCVIIRFVLYGRIKCYFYQNDYSACKDELMTNKLCNDYTCIYFDYHHTNIISQCYITNSTLHVIL